MIMPEGFPPLDDLLPSNPLVHEPPSDLSKLFTSGDSPIFDWNLGRHPLRKESLYAQGYYACLVEIWLMTGLAVHMQIDSRAVDVATECCKRWGRKCKVDPAGGLSWLTIEERR